MASLLDFLALTRQPNYWPFSTGRMSWQGEPVPALIDENNVRINTDNLGPTSTNFEDRRNEPPYHPSVLDGLLGPLRGGYLAYPGRKYGPYDADIDASAARAHQLYSITPALEELARRSNWFDEIDRQRLGEIGKPPPADILHDYESLNRRR